VLTTISLTACTISISICPAQEIKQITPATNENFSGSIQPYQLQIEFLSTPCGIDEPKPRFSWKLKSDKNDQTQSAYQIVVHKKLNPDDKKTLSLVWDSGKVDGNKVLVEYDGQQLEPKSRYIWDLIVWDKQGKSSKTNVSTFSTGIFKSDEWSAKWIGLDKPLQDDEENNILTFDKMLSHEAAWIWTNENALNAPPGHATFRKTFNLTENSELINATLAIVADNEFTAFLNAKKIGHNSDFYTIKNFDVTEILKHGKNTIAIDVTNHGKTPNPAALISLLIIRYKNGKIKIVKTNNDWKSIDYTPKNSEQIDFDDTLWKNSVIIANYTTKPSNSPPINNLPARYLSKNFTVKSKSARSKITRATAYISGLGYYELFINGEKIGDHVLDPVLTDYNKRTTYVTHEIKNTIIKNRQDAINNIKVILGNGRYCWTRRPSGSITHFGYPKLLFQLEIQYADGSTQTIVSDESWKLSTNGAIRDNNDYDGEIYDARKENITFKSNAKIVDAPTGKLAAQMMQPMRIVEQITPKSISQIKPDVWIFDFGVNLVGNCKLKIPEGLSSGTELKLRHAERLLPDRTLYVANLRSALCRDIYIASGTEKKGEREYTPTFTYHGFRYAELSGLPPNFKPDEETLTARVINTDMPRIGTFETSNPTINAIYRNIVRGTQGNCISIPTDCPQRDERMGWQGDRALESKGEMFFFDNMAFYTKWLNDIEDSQRADGGLCDVCPSYWQVYNPNVTWPTAFTLIPNHIYAMYGDRRPIERHYEAMKRWLIGYLGQFVKDGIIDKDNYGDWCVPPEKPELIHSNDPARKTSKPLLATAYYIYNLDLLTRYANMLDKKSDAEEFVKKATEMRKAFNNKFLNAEKAMYDNGTQTSCILPLQFGIAPPDLRGKIFETLTNNIEKVTNNHVGTGLIGGQWLNQVLSEFGRADISFKFTTNTDYPSWGYMIEKDATTIWELWNGDTANPSMNSGNHLMLIGDLTLWYYENLAGIKADLERPGFEHIIMKPIPIGDLKFVNAEFNSVRGTIKSRWQRDGKKFHWEIEIPPGSTATVHIPDGETLKNIPSGKHVFDSELK
jgi:alpha-L-rhamnosidase